MGRSISLLAGSAGLVTIAVADATAQDTIQTTRPREAPPAAQSPAVPDVSTLPDPQPRPARPPEDARRPVFQMPVSDAFVSGGERLSREPGPLTDAANIEWGSLMTRRFAAWPLEVAQVTVPGLSPCQGYFGTEPALALNAEFLRRVRISTESYGDTMLLIRLPDGSWLCDDDSGEGLNASLDLTIGGTEPWLVHVGYYEDYLITPEVTVLVEPDPSIR